MTDELSERTCTRCGRNPLNEVFLVGDERLCFDCKYHKQPAVPSNVDDPETWKGIERSYDAQPAPQTDAEELRSEQMSRFATAPTAAQEPNRFIPDMAHCARCKKADNLHSPDGICPPQEPKANEWMRRAMEQFIYHTEHEPMSSEDALEIGVQVIAAHAPDVTALVESAEQAANKIELYHQTRTGFADDLDDVKAIRTAIAAVKEKANGR